MSSRPKSPPLIKRWPFIAGDIAFLAIALITILSAGSPPALGNVVLAFACVLLGIGLLVTPYLMDFEARVRFSEASAREHSETQSRKVGETAENLANAVSRSQSIEEQAAQALGTLEEMAEKLSVQADDLSQRLTQSNADQLERLKAEIQDITRERDEKLAALGRDIDQLSELIGESRRTADQARQAHGDRLVELAGQLDKITARLDAPAAPAPKPDADIAADAGTSAPTAAAQALEPVSNEPAQEQETTPSHVAEADQPSSEAAPAPKKKAPNPRRATKARKTPRPKATRSKLPSASRGRNISRDADPPSLELELEGKSLEKRPVRRDAETTTSLVATAYIGIGNKLYLRGEGPGLSWDEGVPMQFLAIGKWGWSAPESEPDAQIVCRIYRNDDTPMLDEDIVIAAGSKTEVTPRF